ISVTTPAGTGISGSAFTVTVQPMNLLLNPGFELDSNGNNRPDHWTSNSRFTRTSAQTHSGFYAGKHSATDNSSYTIAQTIKNLNIPHNNFAPATPIVLCHLSLLATTRAAQSAEPERNELESAIL